MIQYSLPMKIFPSLLWVLLLISCFQSELVELETDPDYQPKLVANILLNQHGEIQYQITKSRPTNEFEIIDLRYISEEEKNATLESIKVENANIKLFQDEVLVWETTINNPQLNTETISNFNKEGNWKVIISADGYDEVFSSLEQFPSELKSNFVDSTSTFDDSFVFTFEIEGGANDEYYILEGNNYDGISTKGYSCDYYVSGVANILRNNCFKNSTLKFDTFYQPIFNSTSFIYQTSIYSINESYYNYLSFIEDEERIFSEIADPRLSTTNMSNQLGVFALVNEDKYEFEIR